jgi:hypothetical protein
MARRRGGTYREVLRRQRRPRYLSYRKPRRRARRNPKRTVVYSRGGGGSNLGLYLLIGGAAYFLLLRPGGFGSLFGGFGPQPAIAGYTALGGNAYRNNATGQVVTRTATGQLVTSTGMVAPSGVPNWLQPTVQAGAAAIPQIGIGLAQGLVGALTGGVRALFGGTSVSATTAPDGTAAPAPSSVPVPEAPGAGYVPTLPADVVPIDTGAYLPSSVPMPELPGGIPTVPTVDMSLTLAPVDTSAWNVGPTPTDAAFF